MNLLVMSLENLLELLFVFFLMLVVKLKGLFRGLSSLERELTTLSALLSVEKAHQIYCHELSVMTAPA